MCTSEGVGRGTARWHCVLCGAPAAAGICTGCSEDLPRAAQPPLARRIRGIDALFVPYRYAYPLDVLVRAFKFHRDLAAGNALAMLLSLEVGNHLQQVDRLVPVPLARGRYLARSFNQAALLAQALGRASGIPVAADGVRRVGGGEQQSRLSRAARQRNLADAFTLVQRLDGAHVAIVDDVVTTGATAAALARTLRQGGAARVTLVALAVTDNRRVGAP